MIWVAITVVLAGLIVLGFAAGFYAGMGTTLNDWDTLAERDREIARLRRVCARGNRILRGASAQIAELRSELARREVRG